MISTTPKSRVCSYRVSTSIPVGKEDSNQYRREVGRSLSMFRIGFARLMPVELRKLSRRPDVWTVYQHAVNSDLTFMLNPSQISWTSLQHGPPMGQASFGKRPQVPRCPTKLKWLRQCAHPASDSASAVSDNLCITDLVVHDRAGKCGWNPRKQRTFTRPTQ